MAARWNHSGFEFQAGERPRRSAGQPEESRQPGHRARRLEQLMPRIGLAWSPLDSHRLVVRGGYGMFYERITGGFANSLRQSSPLFRELQINDLGDYNIWPTDYPPFPMPNFVVGFSGGTPRLEGSNAPGSSSRPSSPRSLDPNLATPYTQQWNLNIQWELMPNLMWEVGYAGTKGTKLLQILNANQAFDIDAIGGFLARPGVPGGGFTGNYYSVVNGQFVNLKTPPSNCNLITNPARAPSRRSCVADCWGSTRTKAPTCSSPTATPSTTRSRPACRSASVPDTCSRPTTPSRARSTASRTKHAIRSSTTNRGPSSTADFRTFTASTGSLPAGCGISRSKATCGLTDGRSAGS